jgi:non-specific serine/threonine protein kinase
MRDEIHGGVAGDQSHRGPGLPALPVPVTQPVGRDDELVRISGWLANGVRLVALTGMPGSGKTRLSLHIAHEVQRLSGWPTLFLPLVSLTSAGQIAGEIAHILDLGEYDMPPIQRVQHRLNEMGPVLMVLDNLEHLDGADAVVTALHDQCPALRLLVTSRHVMDLPTAHRYEVPPLPVLREDAGRLELRDNPAVQLFATLAGRAHFTVTHEDLPQVGRICAVLDGLPLAIELAAAKVADLGIDGLLRHLSDHHELLTLEAGAADPRHRSLRAAIAWSYDLLSADARTALNRLAVFTGGFSRETAGRVLHGAPALRPYVPASDRNGLVTRDFADLAELVAVPPLLPPTEHLLQQLVDASLIQTGTGATGEIRFEIFQSIREFGLERLQMSGEATAARFAHAVATLQFVEIAGFQLWTDRTQSRYWARLSEEQGNIRAALTWACDPANDCPTLAAHLAISAWFHFQLGGQVTEGRAWLERALALPGAPAYARLHMMNSLAFGAWTQGDADRAEELARYVIAAWEPGMPDDLLGVAHFNLGLAFWRLGDFEQMAEHLLTAKPIFHQAHDLNGEGFCNLALGVLARFGGDIAQAQMLLDEAYALHTEAGHAWGAATARYLAGETAHDSGDTPAAARLIADGLRRYQDQGDIFGSGACIAALAVFAAERNEIERAAGLFGAAFSMCEHAGVLLPPVDLERYQRIAATVATQVPEAAFRVGRSWPIAQATDEALALAEEVQAGRVPGPVDDPLQSILTPDQRDAVLLLCEGLSVDEIAARLFRDPNTIYDRLARARQRLGVSSNRKLISAVATLRSGSGTTNEP